MCVGLAVIFWVLYNYLVERLPEFTGPQFFIGFGCGLPMLRVGIFWLRKALT